MTISRTHAVAIAAACAHLVLVVCGAIGVTPVPQMFAVGRAIETYRTWSGANNAYGFFAPAVASEWRTEFDVCESPRRCAAVSEDRPNGEAKLLLATIDSFFAQDAGDVIAASWAAVQFTRFPKARFVLVKAQVYDVPTMAQYRTGRRAAWRTAYVFPFTRTVSNSGPPLRR